MPAKKILLDWMAEDDLQEVFEGLFFLAKKYKDEKLRNNTTFQSGRFKALEKQRLNSTITQEEDHLQLAKIRQALLQIIQGVTDDWTLDGMENAAVSTASPSKISLKKYAAYFAAAIALLAGIAELSGYSLKDLFTKKDTTEIPAEVPLPVPNVSSTGDDSPAVIIYDGDGNFNYGDTQPKKDSTRTTSNPKK